ncbi:MAG: hypothetical protein ACREDL_06935, partial [Bradyrhizobium sp.]
MGLLDKVRDLLTGKSAAAQIEIIAAKIQTAEAERARITAEIDSATLAALRGGEAPEIAASERAKRAVEAELTALRRAEAALAVEIAAAAEAEQRQAEAARRREQEAAVARNAQLRDRKLASSQQIEDKLRELRAAIDEDVEIGAELVAATGSAALKRYEDHRHVRLQAALARHGMISEQHDGSARYN